MKKFLFLLVLLIAGSAHQLYLRTDDYFLTPGEESLLYLVNGTFDLSDNVITRDRIIAAEITGPEYNFAPEDSDYYDKNKSTYLKFTAGTAGTYVAGISTKARNIELSAEDFNGYLEHDGILDVLDDRKEQGIDGEAAVETYSKHVKTIFQVGETYSDEYQKVLGYPIEFIPLDNPYALGIGDELSLRLLADGNPVANHLVHYSHRPLEGDASTSDTWLRSDAEGVIRLPITASGKWYVGSIYMVESAESDVDYISNWATLTFAVK